MWICPKCGEAFGDEAAKCRKCFTARPSDSSLGFPMRDRSGPITLRHSDVGIQSTSKRDRLVFDAILGAVIAGAGVAALLASFLWPQTGQNLRVFATIALLIGGMRLVVSRRKLAREVKRSTEP